MPSPIGHGLAGLAIGFAIEPVLPESATTTTRHLSKFALMGALVAAMPDADLLFSVVHRGVSHSVGATLLLMIIAAAVTGWVTRRFGARAVEGLYKVEYVINDGSGRSVLYARDGKMLGGNTAFAHFGTYQNVNGEIVARIRTRRHSTDLGRPGRSPARFITNWVNSSSCVSSLLGL